MKSFKYYIREDLELDFILESILLESEEDPDGNATKRTKVVLPKEPFAEGKVNSDTKGRLHELLVGYHLMGGKHMFKHSSENGRSPEQEHHTLKSLVHPNDYKMINERAKAAADHIRGLVEKDGHQIHEAHWTSQPGDIEKTTKIKSSQTQDASDIVITTKKRGSTEPKYHGVSLKVTDSSSRHVPVSNPGMKAMGDEIQQLHDEHRKNILKRFPMLGSFKNKAERKEFLENNPHIQSAIKSMHADHIQNIVDKLHHNLVNKPHHELSEYVHNVLHSHPTPMEEMGHTHIRHTTYMKNGTPQFHATIPSKHHTHIHDDIGGISVRKSNNGVFFKHNGKTFGSMSVKLTSQSDPFSSLKGSGKTAGD